MTGANAGGLKETGSCEQGHADDHSAIWVRNCRKLKSAGDLNA
jgi:hypothetical protein